MAIYAQGFYGTDTYGTPFNVDFKVDPVLAAPLGYNAIRISWMSPTGNWSRLRLIQSRTGFAVHEDDGLVVMETTAASAEYVDQGLLGTVWYYYTLFIEADGVWHVVGTASALAVANNGMADLMWDRIPRWFRYRINPQDTAPVVVWEPTAEIVDLNSVWQENTTLKDFLEVLGWGLDYLNNYASTLLWANDTRNGHLADVYRLAQTLGEEWEPRVPSYLMRQKVQNSGVLAQRRGTLEGLRELVATSVGYDVDLSVGPNMFLNQDQSGFENPQYPEWDTGVNYATNDIVKYGPNLFKATVGSMGVLPSLDGGTTANTGWTRVTALAMETLRDQTTDAIVTWKAWAGSTYAYQTMVAGVSAAVDQRDNASNALHINRSTGLPGNITVIGAANPAGLGDTYLPTPSAATLQGIPLPRLVAWDPTYVYDDGDYALFQGVSYRSLRTNSGREPDIYANDWQKIGYDGRLPFKYSFWSHGGFTDGTNGPITAAGSAEFFDQQGNHISTVTTPTSLPILDTFNVGTHKILDNRSVDLAPSTSSVVWRTRTGKWVAVQEGDGSGMAWSSGGPGIVTMTGPAWPLSAYVVAATYGPTLASSVQSLVISASSDLQSYIGVNRSNVVQYSAGVPSTLGTLTTPVSDGDRVSVVVDGANKHLTVYVNGVARTSQLTFTIGHTNTYGMKIG